MAKQSRAVWLLALVMALSACKDSGLPGKNLPLEEARTRTFRYNVYDAAANIASVKIGERTWMVAGPPVAIDAKLLRRISGEGEQEVFALATDSEPYSRLYVRVESRYAPLAVTP